MAARAATEEASMMQHRLQLPHPYFYNVGHDATVVSPPSYSMGMVLQKRGDNPSKGLVDSGSVSAGAASGVSLFCLCAGWVTCGMSEGLGTHPWSIPEALPNAPLAGWSRDTITVFTVLGLVNLQFLCAVSCRALPHCDRCWLRSILCRHHVVVDQQGVASRHMAVPRSYLDSP